MSKKQATSIREDGNDDDIEEDDGPELLPLNDIDGKKRKLLFDQPSGKEY